MGRKHLGHQAGYWPESIFMRSWPCPWGISWQGRTDSGKQRVWKEGTFRARLCLCRLKLTSFGRGKTENGSVRGHFDGPRKRRQRPWGGGREQGPADIWESESPGLGFLTTVPASLETTCTWLCLVSHKCPARAWCARRMPLQDQWILLSQLTAPRGSICLSSTHHFVLVEKWKTRFTIYYLWC